MSTAVTKFASLPELLRVLAGNIRSLRQLATLRLVNRTFANAVTPFLFYECTIGRRNVERLYPLAYCEHLGHVRKLNIQHGQDDETVRLIVKEMLLPKMPRLESFSWERAQFVSDVLWVLHRSCPLIKAICIDFPEDEITHLETAENEDADAETEAEAYLVPLRKAVAEREAAAGEDRDGGAGAGNSSADSWIPYPRQSYRDKIYRRPYLAVFTGLEELTLLNLDGNVHWWRSQIVTVLRNSPGLRVLGLSLTVEMMMRHARRGDDAFLRFFDMLCEDYARPLPPPPRLPSAAEPSSRTPLWPGTPPPPPRLQLQSLSLGRAVRASTPSLLKQMTDLRALQAVHAENRNVIFDGSGGMVDVSIEIDEYCDNDGIPYELLGPPVCPNLRRFTLGCYDSTFEFMLLRAAEAHPEWARTLAVSFEEMNDVGLSSVYGPVHCGEYNNSEFYEPEDERNPRHTEFHLRMMDLTLKLHSEALVDFQGNRRPDPYVPMAEEVLANLVADDNGVLEGLALAVAEISPRPGSGHKALSEGFRDIHHVAHALPQLTNLRQLWIKQKTGSRSRLVSDMITGTAHMLAAAGPSLRYIRIYKHSWRIWRDVTGDSGAALRLEELDKWECRDVELFQHSLWVPASESLYE